MQKTYLAKMTSKGIIPAIVDAQATEQAEKREPLTETEWTNMIERIYTTLQTPWTRYLFFEGAWYRVDSDKDGKLTINTHDPDE